MAIAWKTKHNRVMNNKNDIIKKYKENIPITEIAKTYEVSIGCISNNLKLWDAIKRHGIKYLLSNLILEGDNYEIKKNITGKKIYKSLY